MNIRIAAIVFSIAASVLPLRSAEASPARPKAGEKVDILPLSQVKPGMTGTAWTVFSGSEAEPVPIEIVGLWKNVMGPKQDVIIAKMGGKAARTNVAGGMSGSPVYIDGKLAGAVSLRLSVFSPDAICGITPIELMLEINELDKQRPADARTPDKLPANRQSAMAIPSGLLAQAVAAGSGIRFPQQPMMVPIEAPVVFSGFTPETVEAFGPMLQQLGISVVQGGAAGSAKTAKPAPGWQKSLNPGEAIAGVLVSGDMSMTGLGTVTYNDGKRVLAFGHSFFNLGPVSMPMSKGEVLMVLSSAFQPNKFANAGDVVGALRQDRKSGIMGVLGEESEMIPVSVKVRSFAENNTISKERTLRFNVFVQQKWTPYLMMATLYNSISGLNEFREEATYRLTGAVEMKGAQRIALNTMQASGDVPMPAPMLLAGWLGDKFNRLFANNVATPEIRSVNVTVDLLAERRVASIENAWVPNPEVRPGDEVPVKVFLRPYRGERIERELKIRIPAGLAKGDHRIVLSDADTLNRMQSLAGQMNRYIDLPQTVSLLNQERSNNKLYASLVQSNPTAYYDDKTLPNLPASVLNVMQAGRVSNRSLFTSPETASEQAALPFDYVISGSYSLRVTVK
jgi:hypothetical protein